jgi:hypothetical protein
MGIQLSYITAGLYHASTEAAAGFGDATERQQNSIFSTINTYQFKIYITI